MIPLSSEPGLITCIEKEWMHVKVPVGNGCAACPNSSKCTFNGPDRAYRSFRIRRTADCQIGDRVLAFTGTRNFSPIMIFGKRCGGY